MQNDPAIEALLREARAFPWPTLTGAYGASSGADHARDMPGMLEVLATSTDIDASNWGDAYDDALLGHVWHQYSIYPVTPAVVGFVVRIATLRFRTMPAVASNLGLAVQLIAEATHQTRASQEPNGRVLAEATAAALLARREELQSWLGTPLGDSALAIGRFVPELRLLPGV
jgi:hypothetical protein